MTMTLETSRPKALELLHDAVAEMHAYRDEPTRTDHLDAALAKIRASLEEDPHYLRAVYYEAMVDDLRGQPNEALAKYERVLSATEKNPAFSLEVRYNLGVAYYHRYSHQWLDKAIEHFEVVLRSTRDHRLRLLTHAGCAQAHAMHMIPKSPELFDRESLIKHSMQSREHVQAVVHPRQRFLDLFRRPIDPSAKAAAEWAAWNASGMRKMYFADYWDRLEATDREGSSRQELLQDARKDLEGAEKIRKLDWANWCDLGSVHMRLGHAAGADEAAARPEFERAVAYLQRVTKELRPNYGFALYELGRVHRLWRRFPEAEGYLRQVQAIPEGERDVGTRRIKVELERTAEKSVEYP